VTRCLSSRVVRKAISIAMAIPTFRTSCNSNSTSPARCKSGRAGAAPGRGEGAGPRLPVKPRPLSSLCPGGPLSVFGSTRTSRREAVPAERVTEFVALGHNISVIGASDSSKAGRATVCGDLSRPHRSPRVLSCHRWGSERPRCASTGV
jgi:hypothetical protein